ncbi:MAG: GDP-L-fucose synthase [Candidatus Omnitrophota bacterium]|nr:GDP-L-fucose synthase [Candidatus Omnitrophota bacterium]
MRAGLSGTVYVAGHTGLVGSALVRRLTGRRDTELVTTTRPEVDLTDARAVDQFLQRRRPETVIIAAGRVGGIQANAMQPADFIYENLMIEANLIHGAWRAGVERLLNFGSSCMYPKHAPQPMTPELLMTGPVEPTSEPYAVAKWAGLTLCAAYRRQHGVRFITAIPATVYGPGDSFDLERAHVLSALIRKFHEAKTRGEREVVLWGSGRPRREFLYADDLAEACEVVLSRYDAGEPINIGSGIAHTIEELARTIAGIVGFLGRVRWDASQPDGAPEKRLASKCIRSLGWRPRTDLRTGLLQTYRWFLEHEATPMEREQACVSS